VYFKLNVKWKISLDGRSGNYVKEYFNTNLINQLKEPI